MKNRTCEQNGICAGLNRNRMRRMKKLAAGVGMAAALMSTTMMGTSFAVCAATETETEEETTEAAEEATEVEEETTEAAEEETEAAEEATEAAEEETEAAEEETTEAAEEETEVTVEIPESTGNLEMSTAYPGITVKAGETTTFSLDFLNKTDSGMDATLAIAELPEDWTGFFRGDSGQINKVHIPVSEVVSEGLATLSLTLPDDVADGTYEVILTVVSDDGEADSLSLELEVTQEENGESTFTSEYPEQQAASGTSFSFDTTLINNRGTAQSYSLSADTEEGWQVTFTPSSESSSVASVNVEAGSSETITVDITPPETLTKGEYEIPISAISSMENLSTTLKVTITGAYSVSLSTSSGNLSADAYANDEKAITLSVTNTGNVDLTDLNLTSSAPTDWEVTFDESTIDSLEAGATKEITAYIKPDADAMTGDFVTSITVSNNECTSTTDLRITVKTRTSWGIFAVGVIVVLAVGLGVIFKKYGRR